MDDCLEHRFGKKTEWGRGGSIIFLTFAIISDQPLTVEMYITNSVMGCLTNNFPK